MYVPAYDVQYKVQCDGGNFFLRCSLFRLRSGSLIPYLAYPPLNLLLDLLDLHHPLILDLCRL
eukprot:m.376822 g.376822  ORF g.376822 m.376822 type:complete len:63 (+) comp84440_c0_seq1:131-319(+)